MPEAPSTAAASMPFEPVRIGLVSVSDRASGGVYEDKGIPALRDWLGRAQDALALHQAERWRAELIADDAAATRFASAHPGIDMQRLRALVRSARKDAALVPEKRSGRAFRELFQFVRDHESPADA